MYLYQLLFESRFLKAAWRANRRFSRKSSYQCCFSPIMQVEILWRLYSIVRAFLHPRRSKLLFLHSNRSTLDWAAFLVDIRHDSASTLIEMLCIKGCKCLLNTPLALHAVTWSKTVRISTEKILDNCLTLRAWLMPLKTNFMVGSDLSIIGFNFKVLFLAVRHVVFGKNCFYYMQGLENVMCGTNL